MRAESETDRDDSLDQVLIALPPDVWDAFSAALDAPVRNLPELRRLLLEPSVFEGRP